MRPGDRLLYALSAKREMGWAAFKRTFELLCAGGLSGEDLDSIRFARYETARTLDALGHVELDFGSNARLYIARPTLSLLPRSGLPVAVLSGARSLNTIGQLAGYAGRGDRKLHLDIRYHPHESQRFPAKLSVASESVEDLEGLARELNVAFQRVPSSWAILNFSASLSDYLAACEWLRMDKLNWEERQFDIAHLHFSLSHSSGDVQLIRYTHPSRQYPIHYLWRGTDATRVNPDWGRFAVLKEAGLSVLHYDRATCAVIVPATVPLPKLLARSLCLCSGLVPDIIPSSAVIDSPVSSLLFRVYPEVPYEFAKTVAAKLDQALITDFTLLENKND